MKKINLILIGLLFTTQLLSQTKENSVSLTTSGTGKSIEEAKNNALRSAIEQAFGAFISSKTELLNDEVVSDQITSVTSGNIQSFEIKSQDKLPNEIWSITISCIVSVDKLISFVQSKGISVEIKGGLFSINVKQQILNENAEIDNIVSLIGNIHEPLQNSFDYIINAGKPQARDNSNEKWGVTLNVTANTNENFVFCANYLFNTLKSISLSSNEVEEYKAINKDVFPIKIQFGDSITWLYFRKIQSIYALQSLANNIKEFYYKQFKIEWGEKNKCFFGFQLNSNDVFEIFPTAQSEPSYDNEYKPYFCFINLPSNKTQTKSISGVHELTLSELENLSEYKVTPLGISSKFGYGGFIIYEKINYKLGLYMNQNESAIIDSIENNGPAFVSNLKPGDKIISINGEKPVNLNFSDLMNISNYENKKSKFEISRNNEMLSIEIIPQKVKSSLITLPITYGWHKLSEGKLICEKLDIGGFNDWKLPNYAQMKYIHQMIGKRGFGNLLESQRRQGAVDEFYLCSDNNGEKGLKITRRKNWHSDPDVDDIIQYSEYITEITNETGFFIPIRIQEIEMK
jgi:hypothetical protein